MTEPVIEYLSSADKIPYLDFNAFDAKFSFAEYLGRGATGNVYITKNTNVVKIFPSDAQLGRLLIELNINASYKHPCILRPLAWSVDNEHSGYLAMERGKDIITAYK